jgi:hypothetical protein
MSYSIDYDPESETVRVVLSGDITMDTIRTASQAAWRLADAEGGYRFLTEFDAARIKLSSLDLLAIHEHYEAIGIPKYIKSAILVPKDLQTIEDATVHEYVANMSMWQVRVFFDHANAMEWLMA